ncbi:MAG: peroxiredoxin Q/BCP [Hyphomicrobiaceae bacterium]|jgi:peroxiredoxin Q/BCP
MATIGEGDLAPNFSLESQDGTEISLADYRGSAVVVLYFYPKDDTPVCTKEACAFRDSHEDFTDAGAVVIGVSDDNAASHRSFASKHALPFHLVCDPGQAVRKAYGVPRTLGIMPGRVTYVIDREGIVRHVTNSQLFAGRHVNEALETVRRLTATP